MMTRLSPGLRRALALALLLLPIALSALLVVVPVRLAERHEADLAELEAHVERLEQRLVTREQVLAELRRLERVTDLDPRLLAAETLRVAGAALAGRLAEHLQEAGGWLESTQVLEPVLDPPVMRVGVRVHGTVDLAGLRQFLHRIENAEPILTVERIVLRNEDFGERSGLVVAEVTVVGYARAGQNGATPNGIGPTSAAVR
jgi:hypothetical protein